MTERRTFRAGAQFVCTCMETELYAAHGYVETTDGTVGASGINMPGEALNSSGRP